VPRPFDRPTGGCPQMGLGRSAGRGPGARQPVLPSAAGAPTLSGSHPVVSSKKSKRLAASLGSRD
jgi:hypothetical protein